MSATKELLRARFSEVKAEIEAIQGRAAPMRATRDALVNKYRAEIRTLDSEIKEVEAPLFDLQQELAMIARSLKGKTGTPAS